MSQPHELLRAYLRQRQELGDAELVLDRSTPAELAALLRGEGAGSGDASETAVAALPQVAAAPAPRAPAPPREAPRGAPEPVDTHRREGAPVPGSTPHPPAADAPARGVEAAQIIALPTLDALREIALGCPRCRLAETRRHVVFGEGRADADVMVVGEAPGQDEDRSGRPFVGRAGKLLDLLLLSAGWPREQVYICNVLKCRPPQNRNPQPDEVDACSPYLLRQVELVAPRVILTFGNFATQTLLGTDAPISRLRGRVHQYRGLPLVPTYHPAACLRNPGWARFVWEDLQRARELLA